MYDIFGDPIGMNIAAIYSLLAIRLIIDVNDGVFNIVFSFLRRGIRK